MTTDEIINMATEIATKLKAVCMGLAAPGTAQEADAAPAMDPKKAIKETSVTCLECGKTFKVITSKHLATHGLTKEEYLSKYGYPKGTSLIAKGLARDRRKKMKDMKLWERRGNKGQLAE
jgi:predicted transcriptional regulator